MKTIFLLFVLFAFGAIRFSDDNKKVVNIEARNNCKCLKSFDRKFDRTEKKIRHQGKRDNNRLWGISIDFNIEDCLNKKRSKKIKKHINSLSIKAKEKFDRKVRRVMRKKCPEVYSR